MVRDDGVVAAAIRAARHADAVMRRTATGGDMQSYWDWYSDSHPEGVHPNAIYDFAHWYRKHIDPTADRQQVYDFAKDDAFAKGIPQQFSNWGKPTIYRGEIVPNTGQWWNHDFSDPEHDELMGEWEDRIGSPDDQKSKGGIGIGIGPEGEAGIYRPLPISQPKGHNGEGFDPDENPTPFDPRIPLAGGEEGFDPDEDQDPFDPRLIGASRRHAVGENYGGSWHEEHYDNNGDYVGPSWPQDMAHHLHADPAQAPYSAGYHAAWHPAFVDLDDPSGEAESAWSNAGGPTKEIEDFSTFQDGWEDAVNGIPHMWLSPDAHRAYLEGQGDDLRKFNPKRRRDHAEAVRNLRDRPDTGFDPDDKQDPFDPRLIGAGLRRRMASDADPARWPDDLAHHLDEPTGYSAGYAAYHHPAFAGDWHRAEEAFYVDAGGEGLKFEDGFEDAQNGLPHQPDQVSKRYKPLRDVADQLRQQKHNTLSEMGDLTVDEHGRPTRSEGPSAKHPSGSWEGCPTCSPKKGMGDSDYTDPDENIDPFDPRIIGAALEATRYAGAVMRRTAAGPDEPHDDWRPRYGDDPKIQEWHPPFGETHAGYHIWQAGGGNNPVVWGATHHGTYEGTETFNDYPDFEMPVYSLNHDDDEPERLGLFRTPEQAQAAAEKHYEQNYKNRPKMDGLDVDRVMREHGDQPRAGTGLGDDEDYSRIFDAVRRALRQATAALRRVAFDWKPDPDYTDDMETVNAHLTRLENGHEMRVGRWPDRDDGSHRWWWQIYTHAPDYNLGGHFGAGQLTREEAQAAAENQYRQQYPLGTDTGGHKSQIGDSGVDYEKLINPRADLGDEDYGHIFGMLRQAGLDMADIIRLAGDGMSWEDTMAHIDDVLAEGEDHDLHNFPGSGQLPTNVHDVMSEEYLNGPHPGTLPRPGLQYYYHDGVCDHCAEDSTTDEDGYCNNCGESYVDDDS